MEIYYQIYKMTEISILLYLVAAVAFISVALCAIFAILWLRLLKSKKLEIAKMALELDKADSDFRQLLAQKKSSEVTLGHISEQLAPFLDGFKYDTTKLKFLGQPIDYIYFGEDKIVLLDVKSGGSQLSQKQQNIKKLCESGKISFETFRVSGNHSNKSPHKKIKSNDITNK